MRCAIGLAAGVLFLCPLAALPGDRQIKPARTWFGTIKDGDKRKAAPRDRFVANAKEFEALWKVWKPDDKVPEIDFSKNIVVVETEEKGKIDQFILSVNKDGDLTIVVGFTDAKDFPGFTFGMAEVSRTDIKTVERRPVGK